MAIEFIGMFASILLAICGIPQAFQSIKNGHSKGISLLFLWSWLIGESLMGFYVLSKFHWDWPLMSNCIANLLAVIIILKYAYHPRKKKRQKCHD